jgi:hypothetical protein
MTRPIARKIRRVITVGIFCGLTAGCGGNKSNAVSSCAQSCQDDVALTAVREMMKLAYNAELQGQPVGAQDQMTPCPLGGSVHVFGQADSNAVQGATEVMLTYDFNACRWLQSDVTAQENYDMTLTGSVAEQGTLAVQPTSATSLTIASPALSLSGTVYDPPVSYDETDCALQGGQNGDIVSAVLCGRDAGFSF